MKRKFFGDFYGFDALSIFLIGVCILLNLIPLVVVQVLNGDITQDSNIMYLSFVGFIPLAICIFRALSRNHVNRWEENAAFLEWITPVETHINERKELKEQKKVFRFFDCPNCDLRIRVPKGKGRIEITCPKCQTRFIKKT